LLEQLEVMGKIVTLVVERNDPYDVSVTATVVLGSTTDGVIVEMAVAGATTAPPFTGNTKYDVEPEEERL
jgi:hypothetical protein